MDKLRESLERAPTLIRLVPAALGGAIAASALGLADPKILVGALGGVGAIVAARGLASRKAGSGGSADWYCFEVVVVDGEDALAGIRRFLVERSRTVDSEFRIVEHYSGGRRRVVLGVRGTRGEELVLASVAAAILRGRVRLKPLGGCNEVREPVLRMEGPPEGDFYVWLGYDLTRPVLREVYLSRSDVEGHIGIYGSTGSGKSTTLRVIAERVRGDVDVVVLDWTGEHARILSRNGFHVIDPRGEGGFDVVGCSGEKGWEVVLELLSRALDLTEPQAYLVEQLLRGGARSLRGLYEELAALPEESKWDREVKRALARKLGTLLRSAGGAFEGGDCARLSGRVVIDLSGIVEAFSRRAVANLVLSQLFLEARSGRSGQVLAVVDEAHNLVRGDSRDILSIVLAESRKFGLYVAYATQSPSIIGDNALLNTNTKIVHAIRSQRDKRVVIDSLGLGEDWMSRLDKLARGTALLQSPSHPEPILISVQA